MLRTHLICPIVLPRMCLHNQANPFILTYHRIDSNFHIGLNVINPKNFRDHVQFLVRKVKLEKNNQKIRICFDDGYESIFSNAFPIMEEYGIKGIVFPVTGYIGKYNDWDINFRINRARHLNISQIRILSDAGWEIGSHGHLHRAYSKLTNEERILDLNKSKILLEGIVGKSIYSFCPPFGDLPENCWKNITDTGYRQVYLQMPLKRKYSPPGNIKLNFTRSMFSTDNVNKIIKKYNRNKSELIKENFIRSFSWGTILVKEML